MTNPSFSPTMDNLIRNEDADFFHSLLDDGSNVLIEVRCCCEPENLIGWIPFSVGQAHNLPLRYLEGGGIAFDSDHDVDGIRELDGFVERQNKGVAKTWKKTTAQAGFDAVCNQMSIKFHTGTTNYMTPGHTVLVDGASVVEDGVVQRKRLPHNVVAIEVDVHIHDGETGMAQDELDELFFKPAGRYLQEQIADRFIIGQQDVKATDVTSINAGGVRMVNQYENDGNLYRFRVLVLDRKN